MLRSWDEVVRVGVRAALAAAVVGLLVLALAGRAHPAEADPSDEVVDMLVDRTPPSADERVAAAEAVLQRYRTRRMARLFGAIADTAWRGVTGASPRSLLKSGRQVLSELRAWRRRSDAENAALALLEPSVALGESDPRVLELYERLRERERSAHFERALREAEQALERGELGRARRRLARAADLRPDASKIGELRAALERASVLPVDEPPELPPVDPGEVRLAAALLAEQYDRALALSEARPGPDLARGAALFLSGRRERALAEFRALEELEGDAGLFARRLLADPAVDPESSLRGEERRYRIRRALGWIGGEALEEHGLEISRQGLHVWRSSLTPVNLALTLPTRVARRRPADGDALRAAALRYLELEPAGEQRDKAREWLAQLPQSTTLAGERDLWDDGRLVLPRARTPYRPVGARSVIVSGAALEWVEPGFQRSHHELVGAREVALLPSRRPLDEDTLELGREDGLELLASLAGELEAGLLSGTPVETPEALEALRLLEAAVQSGATLYARAWSDDATPVRAALRAALIEGEPEQARRIYFERRKNGLEARRQLLGSDLRCPERTVCIDRARKLGATAYARFDADGDLRIGAYTHISRVSFGLELTESGPRGSLELPLAHWLGLRRWAPFSARIGASMDGVSLRPTFEDEDESGGD